MKSIKKVFVKIFGKARWFLLALLICVIGFIVTLNCKKSIYMDGIFPSSGETAECIEEMSINSSGEIMVDDYNYGNETLIYMDQSTGESYSLLNDQLVTTLKIPDCKNVFSLGDYAYGDDGYLYIHIKIWNEDFEWIESERIIKVTKEFKYVDTLCTIEPEEGTMTRLSRVRNIDYFDGYLYLAAVYDDKAVEYKIETSSGAVQVSGEFRNSECCQEGVFISNVLADDGTFLFSTSDSQYYLAGFNEPFGEATFDNNIDPEAEDHYYFCKFRIDKDAIYFYDLWKQKIFKLEDGEFTPVFSVGDYYDLADIDPDAPDMYDLVDFDIYKGKLIIASRNALFLEGESGFEKRSVDIDISALDQVNAWCNVLSVVGFFVCLVGLTINIIIRKKRLMTKMLSVLIPACVIISLFAFYGIYEKSEKINMEETKRELSAVAELTAISFDEFDFSGMDMNSAQTSDKCMQLKTKLDKLTSDNTADWTALYSYAVFRIDGNGQGRCLANSDDVYTPNDFNVVLGDAVKFEDFINSDERLMQEETLTNFIFGKDTHSDGMTCFAKIYDPDGNVAAYLKVKTDAYDFEMRRADMAMSIFTSIMQMLGVIILVIILLTFRVSHTIKKATKTVSKIADGDLTARTTYHSNDELGEICGQVNQMGESLQTMFDEKDQTEKFYYKFVPEKFKEYLGKERFTDLQLGDADSRELTVLFCDIRGFSINSEIMTAKENFEFVNAIYGKAGPIVREYGGFIDKYIGDAIMALFENADDAVACGIKLYKEIVLNDELAKQLNVSDIKIGVGVHSGLARIGIVGESERLAGTVISDTVNLSSRLESLTKQYKTAMIITKDTVDRMTDPDALDLRYLGIINAAGVNEAKPIFEVLDCLTDDQKGVRDENKVELREAMRLFHLGRREEALEKLKSIKADGRSDEVVDMYIDYIDNLSDDDKSNIIRFDKK